MHFPRLQDVNLEPLWEEEINHKLAIKHALLFLKSMVLVRLSLQMKH